MQKLNCARPTKLMSTHTAVLRVFRKECYNDYLFYNIVHVLFPNLTYWLSVHGASNMDLNILPQFLDWCHIKLGFDVNFTNRIKEFWKMLKRPVW